MTTIQHAIAQSLANNGQTVTVAGTAADAQELRDAAAAPVNGWQHRARVRRSESRVSAGGHSECGGYWRVSVEIA
jgi:hypothetical protein